MSLLSNAIVVSLFFITLSVYDLITKRTIGGGLRRGGVYMLTSSYKSHALSSTITSPFQWHCRLGHPSSARLQLFLSLKSRPSFSCEACQLGKHHQTSLPCDTTTRSFHPFQHVHSDIWGPSPVLGYEGHRYFVIFIDNHSRMCQCYILKKK